MPAPPRPCLRPAPPSASRGTRARRAAAVLLLAGPLALAGAGCEGERDPAIGLAEDLAAAGRWPFWPDRMRIHPLSRFTSRVVDGRTVPVVEARVEFLDLQGLRTRGVGLLSVSLFDGPVTSQLLVQSELDLGDVTTNVAAFDVVTRTYVIALELPEDLPAMASLRLLARFVQRAEDRADADPESLPLWQDTFQLLGPETPQAAEPSAAPADPPSSSIDE